MIQDGSHLARAEEVPGLGGGQGLAGGEDGELRPEQQHHQDDCQQQSVPQDAAPAPGGGGGGLGHITSLLSGAG